MWHISFMGNKKNQEFKNDVLPKNSKKITNNSFCAKVNIKIG